MDPELRFTSGGVEAPLKLVVSPRARTMRLRVDRRSGAVVLTIPKRASRRKALEWAAGHRAWVEAQLARIVPAGRIEDGAELPLHGVPHRIGHRTGSAANQHHAQSAAHGIATGEQ